MKIFKCKKEILKFKDIPQVTYKWKLPILVDEDLNVIAGNSLKDSLINPIYIIQLKLSGQIREDLFKIENAIAEENSIERYNTLEYEVKDYFKELKKPEIESINLFDYKDTTLITEDNYIRPDEKVTYAHGIKKDDNEIEEIIEEYEIDEDILKELI